MSYTKETYVARVVDTLRNIELLVRQPGQDAGDLASRRVPTAKRARKVTVCELPLESARPAFAVGRIATVNNRAVERVDVSSRSGLRGVPTANHGLTR